MGNDELQRYVREAFRQMDQEVTHPSIEQLGEFQRGEMPEVDRARLEKHLSECAPCRERLKEFELFQEDCRAAEPVESREEWQSLRSRLWPGRSRRAMRWNPGWAIAAALVLAVGASLLSWALLRSRTQLLLAEAYHDQRTSELRIAGARFAPLHQERGAGSAFAAPGALLRAELALADQLKAHPEDPDALRMRGEAEMIGRNPVSAVEVLEKARDLRPHDPRILADLGSAYTLRGEAEHQHADFLTALDWLGSALAAQPKNQETLFNHAVTLEKAMLFDQAVQAWERYLEIEPSGEWAEEARRRLTDVKAKLKAREEGLRGMVSDPKEFRRITARGGAVDPEAYLRDQAISAWLPRAAADQDARSAIAGLGSLLKRQGDSWLAEIAAAGYGPEVKAGFEKLAAADRQRNQGTAAIAAVREAEGIFRRAGNMPGQLRARFQEVVALHNSLRYEECLAAGKSLEHDLSARSYARMQARLDIECGICSLRLGRLDEGAAYYRHAIVVSQKAAFGDTAMTAAGKYLAVIGQTGLPSELYESAAQSLQTFWNGAYRPQLFYDVVDELRETAARSDERYAALDLARSAVWAANASGNAAVEALARANLAAAAQNAGSTAETQANLERSAKIFAGLPPGYRLELEIALARIELEQHQAGAALARMEKARGLLPDGASTDRVAYFSVMGDAYQRNGRSAEALQAYRTSVEAGEQRLNSITDQPEREGVLKTLDPSIRGLVTLALVSPEGPSEALRIWKSFRVLDGPRGAQIPRDDRDAALWTIDSRDGLLCWLERGGRSSFHRAEVSQAELAALARRFRRECADPASDPRRLREDGRQLYQWVMEPFAGEIDAAGQRLILELDGALAGVPVQALAAADHRFVGENLSIVLAAGNAAARSAPAVDSRPLKVLVVANPAVTGAGATRFPPLPDSEMEAAVVRAAFPASILLAGRDASLARLNESLPLAQIVHFGGHGYANSENGALILAPEDPAKADYDLLRSADLRRQDWSHCRLAVLAACASAAGETHGPHNPDSLVRALVKAGAERVVASFWDVDSAATAELMRRFYASLAKGDTPAVALRAAQDAVRSHPGWEHPYYWAGFQLYGAI